MTDDGRVEQWQTSTRLSVVVDALSLSETDPATRRLVDTFGGDRFAVRERTVGEPARVSRRLVFASGGEIILHDDAVAAVILHLAPTRDAPRGLDLSEWIASVENDATRDDLEKAIGAKSHFVGIGASYFTLGGGYARADFKGKGGWKEPGNLLSITITAEKPGLALRPEDDECPTCSDLLVRRTDAADADDPDAADHAVDALDVDSTVASLTAALSAGLLTEDVHWVKLADLQPLHASALMDRVESQLTCTTCRRIICLTLFRDSSPTFGYYVRNDAMRRPLEAIPPVDEWGDATRIAQESEAMHYVDHEPGAWFLVEQQGTLYLQARYVVTSMVDDSALIRLDESELKVYRDGGHAYLSDLAGRIHDGSPHLEKSPFHRRDLFRGQAATAYRTAVNAAIVNHTWIAQQRR